MTTQGQDVNLMPWMNACAYKRDDYSWAKVIDELWFKKREKHDFLWNNCYEQPYIRVVCLFMWLNLKIYIKGLIIKDSLIGDFILPLYDR